MSESRSASYSARHRSSLTGGTLLGTIHFNQDASCFATTNASGFRIYSTDPLRELLRRETEEGGVDCVAMLSRSNILGVVPRSTPNRLLLHDERAGRPFAELEFRSPIRRVVLLKDKYIDNDNGIGCFISWCRLFVGLDGKIHVFRMSSNPKPFKSYDAYPGSGGLFAVHSDGDILVLPAMQKGHVTVISSVSSQIHSAHDGALAALALSADGRLYATASDKGTLIRIFEVATGQLLHELRRGTDRARIYHIAFSPDATKLCVTSDKGTLHIFCIPSEPSIKNQSGLNEFLSSLRSLAQFSLGESYSQAAFGTDPTVVYGKQIIPSMVVDDDLECSGVSGWTVSSIEV